MRTRLWVAAAGVLAAAFAASAWFGPGHHRVVREAVPALPGELPAFFRDGADAIAGAATDPDCFLKPIAPPPLADAEGPEHFLSVENVPDLDRLPATRYEFLERVFARKLAPRDVGLLPYAVVEWTQRLTIAFAEHRRWPNDPVVRSKCLIYAGILSHYAADLCQPMHTTMFHDGRPVRGQPTRAGLHAKMDAALGKLAPSADLGQVRAAPFDDLLAGVVAELKRSHALVERVYELEADLPAPGDPLPPESRPAEFLRDRLRAAARFTASLFLTAWRDSEKVKLPAWRRLPTTAPDAGPRPD